MSKSTPIAQIPINNELTDDDDLTVQEVLQQISQTSMMDSNGPSSGTSIADSSDMLDRLKQLEQLEQIQRMSQAVAPPPQTNTATAPTPIPTPSASWSTTTSPLSAAIADLHSIRSMILVVILFIVVSLLPVDVWMAQYVPIHKFPHGAVLVRGLLAGVMYFGIQNYCSSP